MSKAPRTTNGISARSVSSKVTRAMKIKARPIVNRKSGLVLLCFRRYAGSKLDRPTTRETATSAHSVRWSAKMPSPNSGSNPMTKGITAQCTAQTHDATTPTRSMVLSFAKLMFLNKGAALPYSRNKAATTTRTNHSEQSIFPVAPSLSNLSK
jgi:hypothetical protein